MVYGGKRIAKVFGLGGLLEEQRMQGEASRAIQELRGPHGSFSPFHPEYQSMHQALQGYPAQIPPGRDGPLLQAPWFERHRPTQRRQHTPWDPYPPPFHPQIQAPFRQPRSQRFQPAHSRYQRRRLALPRRRRPLYDDSDTEIDIGFSDDELDGLFSESEFSDESFESLGVESGGRSWERRAPSGLKRRGRQGMGPRMGQGMEMDMGMGMGMHGRDAFGGGGGGRMGHEGMGYEGGGMARGPGRLGRNGYRSGYGGEREYDQGGEIFSSGGY